MARDEQTNQGGERLLRAVALALASAGAEDTAAGDLIPQAVWDALYEERLIVLVRDVTGEGMTWTTEAGFEALREIVEEVSQTNQGGERYPMVEFATAGWRGVCSCGWEGPERGGMLAAARDVDAHGAEVPDARS